MFAANELLAASPSLVLLDDADFPDGFVDGEHPDDDLGDPPYAADPDAVMPPQFTVHTRESHERLLMRIAWRVADGRFHNLTFVLDTGSPIPILLGRRAANRLADAGVIRNQSFTLGGVSYGLVLMPANHPIGNVIGLPLLRRWGMVLDDESLEFRRLPRFLGA